MRTLFVAMLVGIAACGSPSKPQPTTAKPSPSVPVVADKPATPAATTSFRAELVAGVPSGAVLQGVVHDVHTKEPLIGVTVVVQSVVLQGEQVAITDERGAFEMTSLPPGAYTLTAYYNDVTTSGKFTIETGKLAKVALDWDIKASGGEVVQVDPPKEPAWKSALEALQHGALVSAYKLGTAELAKAPSSTGHAIVAFARFGGGLEDLRMISLQGGGKQLEQTMTEILAGLDDVQLHLTEAAKDPKFSFELCVACTATEDGFLTLPTGSFDVERDRAGKELPEGDPRRRPTYRFDHGDLIWARAFVSYLQALVITTLAYDWTWIDDLRSHADDMPKLVTIKLRDAAKVAKAKDLLLAGLAASDQCRAEFLAETDDDREWVPSPKQKNYAAPLAVDAKLYQTWADIVGDVRALATGANGLALKGIWAALNEKSAAPAGFVDVAAMLTTPKDIVIELDVFDRIEAEKAPAKRNVLIVNMLKQLLGNGYKATMKPSRITDRLIQLRKDAAGAEDALEDKLKYVLWLN